MYVCFAGYISHLAVWNTTVEMCTVAGKLFAVYLNKGLILIIEIGAGYACNQESVNYSTG